MNDFGAIAIVIFWVAVSIVGMRASYRNGVTDGYGYSKEPNCPGYKVAGEYLKTHMKHRWHELDDSRPKGKIIPPQGGSATSRQHPASVHVNCRCTLPDGSSIYHGDPNSITLKVEQCEN